MGRMHAMRCAAVLYITYPRLFSFLVFSFDSKNRPGATFVYYTQIFGGILLALFVLVDGEAVKMEDVVVGKEKKVPVVPRVFRCCRCCMYHNHLVLL